MRRWLECRTLASRTAVLAGGGIVSFEVFRVGRQRGGQVTPAVFELSELGDVCDPDAAMRAYLPERQLACIHIQLFLLQCESKNQTGTRFSRTTGLMATRVVV
ncbi:hypothetical protein DU475_18315 [Rhodopseudomonas sp. WA056]|nr:hypothetical protein [Rhodopseudomonas sp. WA056]